MHIVRAVIFAESSYAYMYVGLYDSENDRYELYGKIDLDYEIRDALKLTEVPWGTESYPDKYAGLTIFEEMELKRIDLKKLLEPNSEDDINHEKKLWITGQPKDIITSKRPNKWFEPKVILEIGVKRIKYAYGMTDYYLDTAFDCKFIRIYPFEGKGHITTLREMALMEKIDEINNDEIKNNEI
jgi:hypothetical protein